MTRLFISNINAADSVINLSEDDKHYLFGVLRLRNGDEVIVIDDEMMEYHCIIENDYLRITLIEECSNEPNIFITLYQSVSKGERMDLTIQKSVELGVSRIVPVYSHRCVSNANKDSKIDRWQKISKEASRQSRRGIIPEVSSQMLLKEALKDAKENSEITLFAWEEEDVTSLKKALNSGNYRKIAIFVGPEGGYEDKEAALALDYGARIVSLGKRILRTETCGPAMLAMILFDSEM